MGHAIAVFDLDGTITDKDTYLEFIKYSKGKTGYYLGFLILSPFIVLYFLKIISNHRLKERFFSYFFKGQKYSKIKEEGERFSEIVLPTLCRKSALNVLDWHIDRKHEILILSASADIWLNKWCETNSFQLICTEFELRKNKYTGKLKGNNCYGMDKKTRLRDFLSKNDFSYSYGYGDSQADKYFLELVDQPYLMKLTRKNVLTNWKGNL